MGNGGHPAIAVIGIDLVVSVGVGHFRQIPVVPGILVFCQGNASAPVVHAVTGLGGRGRPLNPDLGGIAPDVQGGVIPMPAGSGARDGFAADVAEETVGIPIV